MTRKSICIHRLVAIILLAFLSCLIGCVDLGPPNTRPKQANVVSLDPLNWYILHSDGVPYHPSGDANAAWSFNLPTASGHVGYVQTPFNATEVLHNLTATFRVESESPQYKVLDPTDHLPATVHLFFEIQNDDGGPNGRWWAGSSNYNLGSQDNTTITMVVPLTPDHWTNVVGQSDATSFFVSVDKIGWVGMTFGGQFFFGHGVALTSGSAKYVLIDFSVN